MTIRTKEISAYTKNSLGRGDGDGGILKNLKKETRSSPWREAASRTWAIGHSYAELQAIGFEGEGKRINGIETRKRRREPSWTRESRDKAKRKAEVLKREGPKKGKKKALGERSAHSSGRSCHMSPPESRGRRCAARSSACSDTLLGRTASLGGDGKKKKEL